MHESDSSMVKEDGNISNMFCSNQVRAWFSFICDDGASQSLLFSGTQISGFSTFWHLAFVFLQSQESKKLSSIQDENEFLRMQVTLAFSLSIQSRFMPLSSLTSCFVLQSEGYSKPGRYGISSEVIKFFTWREREIAKVIYCTQYIHQFQVQSLSLSSSLRISLAGLSTICLRSSREE